MENLCNNEVEIWNESKVEAVHCEITQVPKKPYNLKTKFYRVNFSKQKFSALVPCRFCNFYSITYCAQTFGSTILFHFHSQDPEAFLVVMETFVLLVDQVWHGNQHTKFSLQDWEIGCETVPLLCWLSTQDTISWKVCWRL